jgi:prepilin-type N-terminal cleavage/methylation domain-containing protein
MTARRPRRARVRRRRGFTLIEVMIALTLLAFVALGLSTAVAPLMHTATLSRVRTQANEVAAAQIAQVQTWPTYATLEANFAGTVSNFPEPGWTRTTTIVRTGGAGQTNDFKRVTVTVTVPSLPSPVVRTITVAAP